MRPACRAIRAVDLLHKRYGDVVAVDGVSIEVSSGEILGLLGPSGAGKAATYVKYRHGAERPSIVSVRSSLRDSHL